MEAERRCATCKHWDNSLVWAAEAQAGFCGKLSNGVIYVEGERPHAFAIDTPPDFGCVLHEPKQ